MKKVTIFDVLIVYSEVTASSASMAGSLPFPLRSRNQSYNDVYGYFLDVCQEKNLSAAFTTSADIIGPGICKSFWYRKNKQWNKQNKPCRSTLIFDKFSPTNVGIKSRRQLLFSKPSIKPFNDPDLYNLFFDKQQTHDQLLPHTIPTVPLTNNTLTSIKNACKLVTKLAANHPPSDFGTDIIMKDRFGAGGRHVYKFHQHQHRDMLAVIQKNTKVSYIIQPFTLFDRGFSYQNCPASTDIRLIYLNGKIIQSYIRVAKNGEFRCNEHQGGVVTYLSISEIPTALIDKSNTIARFLNKNNSLFSLDFIISNNGNIYFLEGNTGPGLDWNVSLPQNERKSKMLIKLIVNELASRCSPHKKMPCQRETFMVPFSAAQASTITMPLA